ncbi:hypothetical protein HKD37_09G025114 [Glycine soja]
MFIMEAMLSMRRLIESNAVAAVAASTAAEANPILGSTGGLHLGYNRNAYLYSLPPNFTPPTMHENMDHAVPVTFEGQLPQPIGGTREEPRERSQVDPPSPSRGQHSTPCLGLILQEPLNRARYNHYISPSTISPLLAQATEEERRGRSHRDLGSCLAKTQSTPNNTHQYAQHYPSFSARARISSNSAPVQQRTSAPPQRAPTQAPAPARPRPAGNFNPGTNSNPGRNPLVKKLSEFTSIPMSYGDLLPSLIANQLAMVTPRRIHQSPFPRWYNLDATCVYHGGTPRHSIEQCVDLKHKVQSLIDTGWLTFQEDGPNVKSNSLANHREPAVNAIERPKQMKDVVTSRRFIFETLQEAIMISFDGHKGDSCLMHLAASHDMETCSTKPQGSRPISGSKPVLFPYRSDKAVQWRYAPQKPSKKKEEATGIDLLSTKVTNITGLSGVTHSGRVFAAPNPSVRPTDAKGKAKVVVEETNEAGPTLEEDVPAGRFTEKGGDFSGMKASIEFKVIEQLNKTPARVSLLELLMSFEPHRVLLVNVLNEAHVA